MRLVSMTFDEQEDPCPKDITVTMTIQEAAAVATIVGALSPRTCDEMGIPPAPSGDMGPHTVYDALIGDVINRYWEDGVQALISKPRGHLVWRSADSDPGPNVHASDDEPHVVNSGSPRT